MGFGHICNPHGPAICGGIDECLMEPSAHLQIQMAKELEEQLRIALFEKNLAAKEIRELEEEIKEKEKRIIQLCADLTIAEVRIEKSESLNRLLREEIADWEARLIEAIQAGKAHLRGQKIGFLDDNKKPYKPWNAREEGR